MRGWVLMMSAALLCGCVTDSGAPSRLSADRAPETAWRAIPDIVYTPASERAAQSGDLYLPESRGLHPLIVLVHGGGWVRGSRSEMRRIAERAAQRGYAVFNISYRLAPAYPYPAALNDVRAAVAWMRAHAGTYAIDPSRVAVWGYSAGAQLAALAGLQSAQADERVQAVVAGGLPADLTAAADSDLVRAFMGGEMSSIPERYREASPVFQVDAGDPPVFLYHGSWDLTVWERNAQRMKSALDAAGVPAELYIVHGLGHIAMFVFDGGAVSAALDFLDRQMPSPQITVAHGD